MKSQNYHIGGQPPSLEDVGSEIFVPARILLVDREADNLQILRKILEKQSFDVKTVASGEAAVKAFSLESFDLVITEVRLPDLDGIALIKKIKAMDPYIEAIVLTGFSTLDFAVGTTRENGIFAYLTKPLEHSDLLFTAIDKALQVRKARLSKDFVPIDIQNPADSRTKGGVGAVQAGIAPPMVYSRSPESKDTTPKPLPGKENIEIKNIMGAGSFTACLTDELDNIFRVIQGNVNDLALRYCDDSENIDEINRAIKRGTKLIQNLLTETQK